MDRAGIGRTPVQRCMPRMQKQLSERLSTQHLDAKLGAALLGSARRATGLSPDETEAIVQMVDWNVLAAGNHDAMGRNLPQNHLLHVLLPTELTGTMGERTLFDTPVQTLTGVVGCLRLGGKQVEDAFRWIELADTAAFERLRGAMPNASTNSLPSLEAAPGVVERVVRLVWESLEPTTELNVRRRIRDGVSRRRGHGPATVIAKDLGLPTRPGYGFPNRQFPDVGPLIAIAREVDAGLFEELLDAEFSKDHQVLARLDLLASVRWDSVEDKALDKKLNLNRSAAGVRVTGTCELGKPNQKGRFRVKRAASAESGEEPIVDLASAKKMLDRGKVDSALLAQLVALCPGLIKAKPLVAGGPDVVAALSPVASQRVLSSALGQLLKGLPTRRTTESASLIIAVLDKVTPKHLEAAVEHHHVRLVRELVAHGQYSDKQRAKALASAEATCRFGCAKALRAPMK